jgi:hypothetical protein
MRLNYATRGSYHAAAMLSATDAALFTLVADRRVKFRVVCVKIATVTDMVEIFPQRESGKTRDKVAQQNRRD